MLAAHTCWRVISRPTRRARAMHETSVIQSLIDLIQMELAEQGPVRVTSVRLKVGALAGVALEALRFAFDAAAPGTLVEGARLEFVPAPLIIWCPFCMAEREIPVPQPLICPACGRATHDLLGGSELELDHLEIVDLDDVSEHAT
jgi:hydrogenase nickel incorporation protein HypA/HybF